MLQSPPSRRRGLKLWQDTHEAERTCRLLLGGVD